MRRISLAGTTLAIVVAVAAPYAVAQGGPGAMPPAGQGGQQGPQGQGQQGQQGQGQPGQQRAQGAQGGNGGNGGGGGMAGGRAQTMDLATAQKMVATVEAAAGDADEQAAVCIMDTTGDIVVFERMNETNRIPVGTAEGKARAVLMFGVPTADVTSALRSPAPLQVSAPPIGGVPGPITIMRGGLPIYKNGKMIGSIGVGGADSKDAGDETLAQLALAAVGLSSSKDGAAPPAK